MAGRVPATHRRRRLLDNCGRPDTKHDPIPNEVMGSRHKAGNDGSLKAD